MTYLLFPESQHNKLLTETCFFNVLTQVLLFYLQTRCTFFRVKLVFEFEFEISWSLGPWTLEPLNLGTLGPIPSSNTSSLYTPLLIISLHPLTSSYLFLLLFFFGMVWYRGKMSFDIGDRD